MSTEGPEVVKYLVSDSKGEFVIEMAKQGWKVTFANVNPAARGEGGYGGRGEGHCLRVWEGTALRAVFANVTGVRDLAIPLARRVEKQTGSASWTMDSAGNFEGTRKVDVESALVLESAVVEQPF
jgi:hypothetical protein